MNAAPQGPRVPAFVVVGAQKAGTTTLHEWLASDPAFSVPAIKETHFFTDATLREKGLSWYTSQFPENGGLRGEVDPDYLSSPEAARDLRSVVGDVPIVILMRDPIRRSHSQYQMSVRRGLEQRPFADALEAEFTLLANGERASDHLDYLWRSLYSRHIATYRSLFSHVRVYRFEDLVTGSPESRQDFYEDFVRFIFQDPERIVRAPSTHQANPAGRARNGALARLIWDRGSATRLRRFVRTAIPSETVRASAARKLDKLNRADGAATGKLELADVPVGVRQLLLEDIALTATVTGLQLDGWERSLTPNEGAAQNG
ncbi:sulfotransferase [Demequina capsici]|uniref:Sulfotransferase n=1 Tax=Demequina capsici TaxID=3075620 RepID=A0AA96JGD5_9MICO|nr:sulfotransferase [Demequina sp. PMTSA13]WNM27809.1 sulfotransferase [Demequina sp. PMTSA13]